MAATKVLVQALFTVLRVLVTIKPGDTKMKITYSDWPGTPGKINVRADGIKQVFFQDPDGYWIEVNSVVKN